MDDKKLFERHPVGEPMPKFQFTAACNKCGSHDHTNGGCSTAILHEKIARRRAAEEADDSEGKARSRRWGRRPI